MKIVTVIPLEKGLWKEDLTYFTALDEIKNGNIVSVPLRNKKTLGLVVAIENVAPAKSDIKNMSFNLKKIIEIKEHSFFLPEYFEAAIEIGKYSIGNKNNSITSLVPAPLRENYDKIIKMIPKKAKLPFGSSAPKSLKSEKFLFQAPLVDRISSYKTLIRGSFAIKKSVFIVLPTEYDLKVFEESLSKGIEQFTFGIHSGLSAKKILLKFEKIMNLAHPVLILGTAPFLSIPRGDIETIIIEHESSNAYKTIGRPHLDLRTFAELFSTKIGAKLILGDTLLRYESIAREKLDGFVPLYTLSFRVNFPGEIKILRKVKQPEKENKEEKFQILADESLEKIKNTILKKKNVFIFSLRKGLATETLCKDCNETVSCEKCGAPLVLYSSHLGKKRIFICNRCEKEVDGETTCSHCGSWNLIPLGIGTDTVYEYIKEILLKETDFAKTKIFKLDKESVKNTKEAEKIIKEYEETNGAILIGTEMAFYYLRNKVSLSVVASFDSLWSIPNFKMSEKILQIILTLIEKTNERLIIQTKNDTDPLLSAIKMQNFLSFVREEMEDRKKLNYPPYKRFIKVRYLGDKEQTTRTRKILTEVFKEYDPEIFSGFVAKLKDKYATNMLIKMDLKKWSLPELSIGSSLDQNLLNKLLSLPISFDISVDPEDLL